MVGMRFGSFPFRFRFHAFDGILNLRSDRASQADKNMQTERQTELLIVHMVARDYLHSPRETGTRKSRSYRCRAFPSSSLAIWMVENVFRNKTTTVCIKSRPKTRRREVDAVAPQRRKKNDSSKANGAQFFFYEGPYCRATNYSND